MTTADVQKNEMAGRSMEEMQRGGQGGNRREGERQNVGEVERAASVAAGALLVGFGLTRRSIPGLLLAGVGGVLAQRGVTGHCAMYEKMGVNTAKEGAAQPHDYFARGIHVSECFLIGKSPEELYGYWKKFENLPGFMKHLESVKTTDEKRSHWVAKAPSIAGGRVEWDAEIINDEPNRLIAWRSLEGADVDNVGSVRFEKAEGDRGTRVSVVLDYIPPAGRLGKWVAKMFGEEPEQQIREDLRNFKRLMETGEILTIEGQPRGKCLMGGGKREGR